MPLDEYIPEIEQEEEEDSSVSARTALQAEYGNHCFQGSRRIARGPGDDGDGDGGGDENEGDDDGGPPDGGGGGGGALGFGGLLSMLRPVLQVALTLGMLGALFRR